MLDRIGKHAGMPIFLKKNIPNYPVLETLLVTEITYVGENLPALAEGYFDNNEIAYFSRVIRSFVMARYF